MMCAPSCALYMLTQVVTKRQRFSALEKSQFSQKLLKSDPVMNACASTLILGNNSLKDISDLGKDLMVNFLMLRCLHCAMSHSPRKW
jgi:hypothetical protein